MLLSGLAHVTLPDYDDELWIMEGVNGLIIAADVFGDGHYTNYSSDKASVALQIPFKAGKMPEHRVMGHGVCSEAQDSVRHYSLVTGEGSEEEGRQAPLR